MSGGAPTRGASILTTCAEVTKALNSLEAKREEISQLEAEEKRLHHIAEQFNNFKLHHESKVGGEITVR